MWLTGLTYTRPISDSDFYACSGGTLRGLRLWINREVENNNFARSALPEALITRIPIGSEQSHA